MRLLELQLLAFGPFSGTVLDFGGRPALQVIYGPNEAGKSTALRAITGMLYGIPVNTADAHSHPMPDLRIGAHLAAADGTEMHFIRRKGIKNTLLDGEENAVEDGALKRFLGGVSEPLFRVVFGLDHLTLREGAEALLCGGGDVGESLFDAGVGGRGIHRLLEALRREADELFKPRGSTPKLNEALRAFRDAERRTRGSVLSADAWAKQKEAIEERSTIRDRCREEQRHLAAEQNRLQRTLRVLPLLARLRELRCERQEIGEVVMLAADAGERRQRAERELAHCRQESERLAGEIDRLERRQSQLRIPESLVQVDETVVAELQNRLGSHRAAAADLPRRLSELRYLEEEARRVPANLGREVPLEQIEALRVPLPAQAAIKKLAREHSGVRKALSLIEQRLEKREAELEAQQRAAGTLQSPPDLAPLRRAIAAAQRRGEVDESIARLRRAIADTEESAARQMPDLGLPSGSVADLPSLRLPLAESIEAFAERLAALQREEEEGSRREEDLHRRRRRAARGVDELQRAGEVPTEEQLLRRRAGRDELWAQLREAPASTDFPSAAAAYEQAVRDADLLADRLRREADRVAKLASLLAEQGEIAEEERAARAAAAQRAERCDAAEREWRALWNESGVEPRSPAEMRVWLSRVAALRQLAEQYEKSRRDCAEMETRRRESTERLRQELAALGAPPPGSSRESLRELVVYAEEAMTQMQAAAHRRQEITATAASLEEEIADLRRQRDDARLEVESWQREWTVRMQALGLGAEATPEEAVAVLDSLVALFAKMAEISKLQARIDGIRRDGEAFRAEVAHLVDEHAAELSPEPPDQAAEALLAAYHRGRADAQERQGIAAELTEKHSACAELRERLQGAETQLALLMRQADAASTADLEEIERRSRRAADIDAEVERLDRELLQLGDGATVEELLAQTRDVDADDARARLGEIAEAMEAARDRQAALDHELGGLENGLDQLASRSGADDAAEAQEHLAAIRVYARRYLRARLAALVLEREIDRYRDRNQGPVLSRANHIFPKLTLGRYTALRAGFDAGDRAVLECVRGDGKRVGVGGLSDGTRDQLYLSLRLASLEHYAQQNEPMPLVLDDILIHFDDARARAALEVLGELARRGQILFFTHHARLLELAREAVPDCVEHRLEPAPLEAAAVAGG